MQVIHPAEGIRVFADAGLILFWQVDYCSNNIRLVLLMQTASTHCSLACERACAVRSVLEPLNSGGYWVQRGHPPTPQSFLLPALPSSLLNSSSGFLPPWRLEKRPLTTAAVLFYFAWTVKTWTWAVKTSPPVHFRRSTPALSQASALCRFYNSRRQSMWYLSSWLTGGPGRLGFPECFSLIESLLRPLPVAAVVNAQAQAGNWMKLQSKAGSSTT